MRSDNEIAKCIDSLMGSDLLHQAQIEVLLSLCGSLARRLGVDPFEGLSAVDWFQREKLAKLETILIEMEDKDPASAAFLQNIMDQARNRSGEPPTEV